jgi:glycosyltransferase involved in cell wall biosynthesis
LVIRLDERYRPCVLMPSEEDFARVLREKGIGVVVLDLPPIRFGTLLKSLGAILKLIKIIKEFDIALVHTDGPRNTFYAGVAGKLRHLPVVFHVRDANRDRYDALSCWLSARIILVARALRVRFAGVAEEKKFVTIYNGLDLNRFFVKGGGHPQERGDGAPLITVLSMGRIEPQKGQKTLVEACSLLANPALRLILVGEIVDEAYAGACREMARQKGMADRMVLTGHREDVAELLGNADIFASPSTGEAFSRAVIEAMAAGLPIVATDVGGTKEAVIEGVTGFIVPPADPGAMAGKILTLAADEPLRRRFGTAARKRAEALFSIEGNVQKTEQIYDELLGRWDR